MLSFMINRISNQESLIRNKHLDTDYVLPRQYPKKNDMVNCKYNGKPFDLLYGDQPNVSRPLLLDEYGDDLEIGRNLQFINTTNKEFKPVSGYSVYPTNIPKDPTTTSKRPIVGILA